MSKTKPFSVYSLGGSAGQVIEASGEILSNVVDIALEGGYSEEYLVVKADGTVWTWGNVWILNEDRVISAQPLAIELKQFIFKHFA